ncbi:nucleic acid dioxygenase ALKBH1 isoform X2 [Periplaneta americana]
MVSKYMGLKPIDEWRIYELTNKPGLLFIPNPFTALGQRYWVCRCMRDFTCKPQKLNIDPHGYLKEGEKWWEICTKDPERGRTLLQKLRWATLGYHHNWDTKVYSEDAHDLFPEDLAELCELVAKAVGFHNFSAQAAIVNYYHLDSTLSGHTDHSEIDKDAPLFSFSFGQSAIFLLGGKSVEEKPIAMLICSGDIVIMSGQSRLCYHGVPRILATDKAPWNDLIIEKQNRSDVCEKVFECADSTLWKPFESYLRTSRINMNVRQVLKPGVTSLVQQSE